MKDLSASAELRQLYMYFFASEVRWGTSELTLFQETKKKKPVRSRDMPPDADTALRPRYYLYIEVGYFCMRYFMNTENGQRINVIKGGSANSQTGCQTNFGSLWLFLGFGIPRSSHYP